MNPLPFGLTSSVLLSIIYTIVRLVGILAAVIVLRRISGIFIRVSIGKMMSENKSLRKDERKKRTETIIRIFTNATNILVYVLGGMIVLSALGIDIGPLLAAAGVAGLALGFGGQYLIRDVISGLFIILENHYRVGDVACLDDTCGLVEDITLRMTVLRDLDGTVHHVPNGEIKRSSNLSKEFARVNLNIGVSYSSNMEKVIRVVNEVGNDMAKDPKWKHDILQPPQFLRVDDFADSSVMIKILGDTKPLRQWDVAGEFRKRLKIAFDKEGIEIPFPQRVIYQKK